MDVTKIEQKLLEKNDDKNNNLLNLNNSLDGSEQFLTFKEKSQKYVLAPDISTPDGFINTNDLAITISEFKGKKVVLLDIWTYSCINCQRTLPYLNEWYKKYEDEGLVIIGLHTPEFAFEKIQKNVAKAVVDFNVKYPVVLDNDFSTWRAYKNQYWPRKYLIDIDGYIVYDHAGEGHYQETELAIQKALKERAERLNTTLGGLGDTVNPNNVVVVDSSKVKSPEIYFGSARNSLLGNGRSGDEGEKVFSLPTKIIGNKLYLGGTWNMTPEYAENKTVAEIVFAYEAKNVYMVASSVDGIEVEVYQDDKFIKKINIKDEQLYSLIEGIDYGQHILRIKIPQSGLKAFTFTFG